MNLVLVSIVIFVIAVILVKGLSTLETFSQNRNYTIVAVNTLEPYGCCLSHYEAKLTKKCTPTSKCACQSTSYCRQMGIWKNYWAWNQNGYTVVSYSKVGNNKPFAKYKGRIVWHLGTYNSLYLAQKNTPSAVNPNSAYLSFMVDDHLHVYYDPKGKKPTNKMPATHGLKLILNAKYNGWRKAESVELKNFKPGDKILFYWLNTIGSGGFAGHIFYNGKFYPTNSEYFKITGVSSGNSRHLHQAGYKYGCYRDRPNRALSTHHGWNHSTEECRDKALKANQNLYSLQAGGYCFTGNDINRATRYGKLPDRYCALMKNKHNRNQHLGGGWANLLYSARYPPKIRHYLKLNKQGIHKDAWILNSNEGLNSHHGVGSWYQIEFTIPKPSPIVDFCPDPAYTEFNPSACKSLFGRTNPNNVKQSCQESYHQNYRPNMSKCLNKYSISGNNYNNSDFFSLVSTVLKTKKLSKSNTGVVNKFNESFKSVMSLACKIREMDDSYFNIKNCDFTGDISNKIPEIFDNITKAIQICKNKQTGKDLVEGSVVERDGDNYLCERFNDDMRTVIDTARIITAALTQRRDCECMKFTKSGPKCMPC